MHYGISKAGGKFYLSLLFSWGIILEIKGPEAIFLFFPFFWRETKKLSFSPSLEGLLSCFFIALFRQNKVFLSFFALRENENKTAGKGEKQ